MKVPCAVSDFGPPREALNTLQEMQISWSMLFWAAITVGRRSALDVFQHGKYSWFEVIYRKAILLANLRETGSGTLVRSPAYNGLDPSEKGAISYFLGMTMTKAFAEIALGVPWLMHLDVYRSQLEPVGLSGRARPDLVGQTAEQQKWVVLEAKGRTYGFDQGALNRAKLQAEKLTSVSGEPPCLRVGAVTHFGDGRLQFAASDPPSGKHRRHIELLLTREEFLRSYYAPFRSLVRTAGAYELIRDETKYRVVNVEPADMKIGLREDLALATDNDTPKFGPVAQRPSSGYGYYAGTDGVLVELGLSKGSGPTIES